MGRQPTILARANHVSRLLPVIRASRVVAVGHADGAVRLVRVEDDGLILAREADGQAVSALGWDETGQALGFGTGSGTQACSPCDRPICPQYDALPVLRAGL